MDHRILKYLFTYSDCLHHKLLVVFWCYVGFSIVLRIVSNYEIAAVDDFVLNCIVCSGVMKNSHRIVPEQM